MSGARVERRPTNTSGARTLLTLSILLTVPVLQRVDRRRTLSLLFGLDVIPKFRSVDVIDATERGSVDALLGDNLRLGQKIAPVRVCE